MKAFWTSINGEYDDLEADVVTCKLVADKINIIFRSTEDGEAVQGRISIHAHSKRQAVQGIWIYPDSKKRPVSFADRTPESTHTEIYASVTGKLENYRSKKVVFLGEWLDPDGTAYEFEIDAELA